jgi:hypothetical protein
VEDEEQQAAAEERDPERPPTPRWVKVFVLVGAVLLAAFVILLVLGGHGPQRHGAELRLTDVVGARA